MGGAKLYIGKGLQPAGTPGSGLFGGSKEIRSAGRQCIREASLGSDRQGRVAPLELCAVSQDNCRAAAQVRVGLPAPAPVPD